MTAARRPDADIHRAACKTELTEAPAHEHGSARAGRTSVASRGVGMTWPSKGSPGFQTDSI